MFKQSHSILYVFIFQIQSAFSGLPQRQIYTDVNTDVNIAIRYYQLCNTTHPHHQRLDNNDKGGGKGGGVPIQSSQQVYLQTLSLS